MVDYIYNPMKNGKNHSIIGDGKTRINPVDGRDVATYIADCVDRPEGRSGDLQVLVHAFYSPFPTLFLFPTISSGLYYSISDSMFLFPKICLWLHSSVSDSVL